MKPFLILGSAAVLQIALFSHLGWYGITFHAVLVALAYIGFYQGNYHAFIMPALVAGILLDAASGFPFGVLTVSTLAALWVLSMMASVLPHRTFWHLCFFLLGALLAHNGALTALTYALSATHLSQHLSFISFSFYGFWREALATAVGALLIYPLRTWITL